MREARHHFVSAATLKRVAVDVRLPITVVMKAALGLPVEPADRAAILEALRARGLDADSLPCVRRASSPLTGSIPKRTGSTNLE